MFGRRYRKKRDRVFVSEGFWRAVLRLRLTRNLFEALKETTRPAPRPDPAACAEQGQPAEEVRAIQECTDECSKGPKCSTATAPSKNPLGAKYETVEHMNACGEPAETLQEVW